MSEHDELASERGSQVTAPLPARQQEEIHGEYDMPPDAAEKIATMNDIIAVPSALTRYILPHRWGRDHITRLPTNLTEKQRSLALNTIAAFCLGESEYNNYLGGELLYHTQEDLADWSVNDFEAIDPKVLTGLRDFLVNRGVWVDRRKHPSIAQRVFDTLQQEEGTHWTDEMIAIVGRASRDFRERLEDPDFLEDIKGREIIVYGTKTVDTRPSPATTHQTSYNNPAFTPPPPSSTPKPRVTAEINGPRVMTTAPPRELSLTAATSTATSGPTPKQMSDLMKMYSDDQTAKYTGGQYETIDSKLPLFYDLCVQVGITQDHYGAAIRVMLQGEPREYYTSTLRQQAGDFDALIVKLKERFEGDEVHLARIAELRRTSFNSIARENHGKNKLEILELLIKRVTELVKATTRNGLPKDEDYRECLITCCRGIPECAVALLNPPATFYGLCAQLRNGVANTLLCREPPAQYPADESTAEDEQFWVDRKYNGSRNNRANPRRTRGSSRSDRYGKNQRSDESTKKCFVCGKPGCWSTKHTKEERQSSFNRYKSTYFAQASPATFNHFLLDYEGCDMSHLQEASDGEEQHSDDDDNHVDTAFFTSTTFFTQPSIDGPTVFSELRNQATAHALTHENPLEEPPPSKPAKSDEIFTLDERYSAATFHGIMPDTGAAEKSTAGHEQYLALQRHLGKKIPIDTARAGEASIRFGSGDCFESLGAINVPTPLGDLVFHVITTNTPFLFCLRDMDRYGVKFDNLADQLIQGDNVVPVVRRFGHPWMLLHPPEKSIAGQHLTDGELRQIHRRFGHPSVQRLYKLLERAGENTSLSSIEAINKYCRHCQLHSKAPGRFKFTLRDDNEFNHEILVDVMYLDGNKPVLHVVDAATAFNAARFLRSITAEHTWEALRMCWINVYLGPPD